MLDSWALRVLVEVADTGSLSAAGKSLSMTQPAVSRQVQNLERRLGVTLFRREPRGVRPTPAGEAAIEQARGVLGQITALESTVRAHAGLEAGTLRISAYASANTAFVPEVIRRFSAEYPAVTLQLLAPDPDGPLTAVRDARVDLALLTEWQLYHHPILSRAEPHPSALTHGELAGIDLVELLAEHLYIALPSGHRLARSRGVRLAELQSEVWIDGAFPDCLGPLEPLAAGLGRAPRIGFFCDDWNGKLALVAAGAGVMLVPQLALPAVRTGVELRRTSPALPTRTVYAAVPSNPYRSPPTTAMLDIISDMATAVRRL